VGSTDLTLITSMDAYPNDTLVWKRIAEPLITKMAYQIVLGAKIADIKVKVSTKVRGNLK